MIIHSVSVPGTQLDVKLATQVGQPYDAATVEKDVRFLWSLGRFDDVRVEEPEPGALVFRVKFRPRLLLHEIRVEPHSFALELQMPPGTPIDPVVARQIARGVEQQLHASVKETLVPLGDGEADLKLNVTQEKEVREPPRDDIKYEVSKEMCRSLFLERRDAERKGILEFNAHFDFEQGITIERGPPYRVGRIDFIGNHRYSDGLVRSHLLLDEGAIFDERLLRLSVARLNRSGLFNPLNERDVIVRRDPSTGFADVTLRLTERKGGSWNLAGPWPWEGSVSARLPKLATLIASLSIIGPSISILTIPHPYVPVLAIQHPYTPGEGWKSGFAIAPQLGLSGAGFGYVGSQLQHRLLPLISGERSAEPPLPLTGDIQTSCEAKPRLKVLRTAGTFAVQFLGILSGL